MSSTATTCSPSGATVHSAPSFTLPVMLCPRGRNCTVSPCASRLMWPSAHPIRPPVPTWAEQDERPCCLEPVAGYDPATYGLRNRCSTTELHRQVGRDRYPSRGGFARIYGVETTCPFCAERSSSDGVTAYLGC